MTPPILLVGEAYGESEAKAGVGFIGASGAELIRMLGESGMMNLSPHDRELLHQYYLRGDWHQLNAIWNLHPEIIRTNVFNLHPPRNDLEYFCGPKTTAIEGYPPLLKSKFVRAEFAPQLSRLGDEILQHNPNIIICLGNCALWALAGRVGITKLRGTTLLSTHIVADYKLLPTFHPAAILRQYENRPIVIADLAKAHRESTSPTISRPHREIWIEPSLLDITNFIDTHVLRCRLLSVDIETAGSRITCIGFAPRPDIAIVIPFDDARSAGGSYWPSRQAERSVWDIIRGVLEDGSIPKLFQNGAYDIAFLTRSIGILVKGASEDTMLLHHALQPESLKGLGFLGSVYSNEGAWKHMRGKYETIKRDE